MRQDIPDARSDRTWCSNAKDLGRPEPFVTTMSVTQLWVESVCAGLGCGYVKGYVGGSPVGQA
jgi:hypothetical protein